MKKDVVNFKLFILIAIIVLLICVAGIVCFILFDRESDSGSDDIFYYPANYDEDIMQNSAYLSFNRDLLYSCGGVEQQFSYENDRDDATAECGFFLDYFNALISGDNDAFVRFYCEDYFEEQPNITRQMIYEPYVFYHSVTQEEIDGKEVSLYNFHVRYAIFKNNGTFRKGVASNSAVPQIYQLIKTDDGEYKIYRILEIEFKDEA